MNLDQSKTIIHMALVDFCDMCMRGEDYADQRSELDEAWNVLLSHTVPLVWAVYRCDRATGEEIDTAATGFVSASAAMDAANAFQRVNPGHRYTVGEA